MTAEITNTRNGHVSELAAAQTAARELFDALGLSLRGESLANTPARFAAALAELLTPREFDATTFSNDSGARASGTRTVTSAFTGSLRDSADTRREFTTMIEMH